jgi:hypothetical protein
MILIILSVWGMCLSRVRWDWVQLITIALFAPLYLHGLGVL